MNYELNHEQLYQIIFGGDRSKGWQIWERNLASETGCPEGSIGQMGKTKTKPSTSWKGGESITSGYRQIWLPIHPRAVKTGYVLEHILVCEQALGHFLPEGAVPHHVNEIRSDNRPVNLVLCQDRAYHNTIHKRMRALKECGNSDRHRCKFCHKWDSEENLYVRPIKNKNEIVSYHRLCMQDYKAAKAAERGVIKVRRGSYSKKA